MLDPTKLGFRRLQMDDLPLMYHWLNTDFVNKWYGEARTPEEVAARYAPKINGDVPTDPYLILHDAAPIGYIQTYKIADWPDYSRCVQVEENAAGVDLFIGEQEYIHRGLGPHILRTFLREVVFADPGVTCCVLGPEPKNRAAIRAYEKAGFTYLRTVQLPDEAAPEYLMRIGREDAAQSSPRHGTKGLL